MKPRNLLLGLVGACAACCAVPLAAPLFGSAVIAGAIAGFGEVSERIAALGGAILVAFLIWRRWRSQRDLIDGAGEACGCATAASPAAIACTLTPGDFKGRVQRIRDLARASLRDARREPLALHLTYDVSSAARVREMVRQEEACCAFLRFDLREDARGIHLSITAPQEASAAANDLFAHFAPELATSQSSATSKETV